VLAEEAVDGLAVGAALGGQDQRVLDRLQTTLVCGLVDVAKEYVLVGAGLALMYVTDEVQRRTPGLCVRALDGVERLPIEMAVRKGAHLPEPVQELRQVIRRFLAQPQQARSEKEA
jgi:DNA-binding transcriptional LysR family regulator